MPDAPEPIRAGDAAAPSGPADQALPPTLRRERAANAPRRRRWWVGVSILLVAGAVAASLALLATRHHAGPAAPAASATTDGRNPTTTTTAVPPTRQGTAQAAADRLVGAWAGGDRARASAGATADAVETLFAVPYPAGQAVDRGCSTGAAPVACSFGPPGGGNPGDPIFILQVAQAADGSWYVSAVRIEH
jgi:hypothetical protein